MTPREDSLVSHLIAELENQQLQYAVLRNYEDYPNFGNDLDIVLRKQDVQKWRNIALQVGVEEGWNILTECDHWSDPVTDHLNIEVFRFYTEEPPQMLQVDIFHGFGIFSTPLYGEAELLENRQTDERGPFTHIEPTKEMLFKLLQLNSLYRNPRNAVKCARYRDRILSFHDDNKTSFEAAVSKKFGSHGIDAIMFLRNDDFTRFGTSITLGKKRYLLNYVLRNPFASLTSITRRMIGYIRQYYSRPCGSSILVHANNTKQRQLLRESLEGLNAAGVLYCWSESKSALLVFDRAASRVMERGGIVIQWSNDPDNCDILLTEERSTDELSRYLFNILINRHKAIY